MQVTGIKLNGQIIDGRALAEKINLETRRQIVEEKLAPELAMILIGDNQASQLYINLKKQACEAVGIESHRYLFDDSATENEILDTIDFLNQDNTINGILIQLPLPEKFAEAKLIERLDPKKDVDGFHPENLRLLTADKPYIKSPLVLGIEALIAETKVDLTNKKIVILSNSPVFAEPFKAVYRHNEIVSITRNDENVKKICHEADILIVAIGEANFITTDFIKDNAILIDVGINKLDGKTVGDVDFDNAMLKASFISPVPGGVGPMTIAYLLRNTVELYKKQIGSANMPQ